ncbi:putative poly(A)-specific ribonuclease [Rosa chinensis]|uniref:poly(A)-specific ribonuclease n=1 Tax=Rosa chinensis TaxID=74649 RepID=A0A2P6RVU9_ROSCH|nr:putative poly(A)-specific ribonuclease [Rosa chinensis]
MMIVQRGILIFPIGPASHFHGGVPVVFHRRPMPQIPLHHHPIPLYPPQFQSRVPVFRVVGAPICRQGSVKKADQFKVRRVCRYNFKVEIAVIQSLIRAGYRFASFDTEFPGTVVKSEIPKHLISQAVLVDVYKKKHRNGYKMMKTNVDQTHIIHLGLSLSYPFGNFPVYDGAYCCWEFNFNDFDVDCANHLRNSVSIDVLKRQGIDFSENKCTGICSADFAEEIKRSGLVELLPCLTWATFQSAYDFGYLIKMFTGNKELPEDIKEFMGNVKTYFGPNVYDIKYMMKFCDGLFGGLNSVAETLGVDCVAGSSHQAGSDSLLTLQTFAKMLKMEKNKGKRLWEECGGVLFGSGNLDFWHHC